MLEYISVWFRHGLVSHSQPCLLTAAYPVLIKAYGIMSSVFSFNLN